MRVLVGHYRRGWVVAVVAAGGLLLAACGGGATAAAPTPTAIAGASVPGFVPSGQPPAPSSAAMPGMSGMAGPGGGPSTAPAVGGTAVTIQNFAFSPAVLTVRVGSTVTWTNKDTDTHTVTTANGPLHSPAMGTGATFSHTFTAAGTFHYLCTIHPFMTATVTVTP